MGVGPLPFKKGKMTWVRKRREGKRKITREGEERGREMEKKDGMGKHIGEQSTHGGVWGCVG